MPTPPLRLFGPRKSSTWALLVDLYVNVKATYHSTAQKYQHRCATFRARQHRVVNTTGRIRSTRHLVTMN